MEELDEIIDEENDGGSTTTLDVIAADFDTQKKLSLVCPAAANKSLSAAQENKARNNALLVLPFDFFFCAPRRSRTPGTRRRPARPARPQRPRLFRKQD